MNVSAIYNLQTEAQWLEQVRRIAARHGFRTYHTRSSRGSDKGFPDLVLVRPPTPGRPARVIFAELKAERTRLTRDQRAWLADLQDSGQETHVWRPRDEAFIEETLRR